MRKNINQKEEARNGREVSGVLNFKYMFKMLLKELKNTVEAEKAKIPRHKFEKYLKKKWQHAAVAWKKSSQDEKMISLGEKSTLTNKGFCQSLIEAMPQEAQETFKQNVSNYVPGERPSHWEIMKELLDLDDDEIIDDSFATIINRKKGKGVKDDEA